MFKIICPHCSWSFKAQVLNWMRCYSFIYNCPNCGEHIVDLVDQALKILKGPDYSERYPPQMTIKAPITALDAPIKNMTIEQEPAPTLNFTYNHSCGDENVEFVNGREGHICKSCHKVVRW